MFIQKPSNSKIIEKLKILKKRLNSVLIQVYHLKNVLLSHDGSFNAINSDPAFEPAIKLLARKFPNIDIKSNRSSLEHLTAIHQRIINELYFHYYTLVDVLEIKDNLLDLFGQISAFQFSLDINSNFDMTRCYLEIIADYSTVMIILSNIPQIRSILLLYNVATLSKFDQDERYYHRLCERLVEKHKDGSGISELYNELNPYSKSIIAAVGSLSDIVKSKQLPIAGWDNSNQFSLAHKPSSPLSRVSLLPYSVLERWVVLGYLAVYPEILKNHAISQLFRTVLTFSYNIVLFRNELLQVHPFLLRFFDSQKGYSKLAAVVRDSTKELTGVATTLHRRRRNYLRLLMRHQLQHIVDWPAEMALHTPVYCLIAALAADELHWLVRHCDPLPSKKLCQIKPDELVDPQLPELMHQLEEIRHLLQEVGVVTEYHRQVLRSVDLPMLRQYLDSVSDFVDPEETEMLEEFAERLETCDEVPDGGEKLFKELRLDWCRLQTSWSYSGARFPWKENQALVAFMNQMVMHTHFVDNLQGFLDGFSSMGFLYWHRVRVGEWFDGNLRLAAQQRYAVVFARICDQFLAGCDAQACPDDYNAVLRTSTEMAHVFVGRVCQEVCKLMTAMVKGHFEMGLGVQAQSAVDAFQRQQLLRRQNEQAHTAGGGGASAGGGGKGGVAGKGVALPVMPGGESKRGDIAQPTQLDMEMMALNQLTTGLNSRVVAVNGRLFSPNVYLRKELVKFLSERFVMLSNIQ